MSQIHSALAYYWNCKQELDADIERRQYAQRLQQQAGESPLAKRLRAKGLIPALTVAKKVSLKQSRSIMHANEIGSCTNFP